jgi:AcrR family transcriptional regulator
MRAMAGQVRPYGGVQASDRLAARRRQLIEAGLDLLGGQTGPDDLTVRAICAQANLTVRYFYENFADKDEFVGAVYDSVAARLAVTTQASVAAAPAAEQNRAGITNLVRFVADDARVGRLLFSDRLSNAVLLRKRAQQEDLLISLSGQHLQAALNVGGSNRLQATTHFVFGGIRQAMSAWQSGEVQLSADELVDLLVAILDDLNDPGLFRD